VQLAPEASYRASRGDPRRKAMLVRMRAEHVLASAAFPWLFPPRRIDGAYYCDGGLRLNTPLAPALRAGCDRLLVVSLLSRAQAQPAWAEPVAPRTSLERERVQAFHSPVFLLGKLLDALLLDPIDYDLSVLERFNRLVEVLECQLDPDQMEHVRAVLTRARGTPYRRVPALCFAPSRDLGSIAAQFLEGSRRRSLSVWVLNTLRRLSHTWEADLMSFLLLDGEFARELIELGRADVRARADEVLQFFAREGSEP
jgi:NTE family protein